MGDMIKQSVLKRKPKSDVARTFIGVLDRDNKGRGKVVLVPGSWAKRYHVILRRFTGRITVECRLSNRLGYIVCPGNSRRGEKGTICYHSRAAVDFAVGEAGMRAYWCQSKEDQLKVQQMVGGLCVEVVSHQNGARAYVVVAEEG